MGGTREGLEQQPCTGRVEDLPEGLGRLCTGTTPLHCRHQGPHWWLLKCVRKPQASERAPQASLLLLLLPRPLPRSTHTRRACSCRMRPRTILASSSEWPHV